MKPRAILAILLVCGVAPVVLDRVTQLAASDDLHHAGFVDRRLVGSGPRLLPGLRGLFVQLWLTRIDSALRRGDRASALRFAREALAVGPDLAVGRIRIAERFAFSFAPYPRGSAQPSLNASAEPSLRASAEPSLRASAEPSLRASAENVAWIEEAIALLDEGIVRDSRDPQLHYARGIILWLRGLYVPEFAAAFRENRGTSTLDAATDSLLRAVELARFDFDKLVAASSLLCARAEESLDRGKQFEDALESRQGERFEALLAALGAARADFERAADYLGTLEALAEQPGESLRNALEIARVSAELIALNEELARGHGVDLERVGKLRARRIELRTLEQETR